MGYGDGIGACRESGRGESCTAVTAPGVGIRSSASCSSGSCGRACIAEAGGSGYGSYGDTEGCSGLGDGSCSRSGAGMVIGYGDGIGACRESGRGESCTAVTAPGVGIRSSASCSSGSCGRACIAEAGDSGYGSYGDTEGCSGLGDGSCSRSGAGMVIGYGDGIGACREGGRGESCTAVTAPGVGIRRSTACSSGSCGCACITKAGNTGYGSYGYTQCS